MKSGVSIVKDPFYLSSDKTAEFGSKFKTYSRRVKSSADLRSNSAMLRPSSLDALLYLPPSQPARLKSSAVISRREQSHAQRFNASHSPGAENYKPRTPAQFRCSRGCTRCPHHQVYDFVRSRVVATSFAMP